MLDRQRIGVDADRRGDAIQVPSPAVRAYLRAAKAATGALAIVRHSQEMRPRTSKPSPRHCMSRSRRTLLLLNALKSACSALALRSTRQSAPGRCHFSMPRIAAHAAPLLPKVDASHHMPSAMIGFAAHCTSAPRAAISALSDRTLIEQALRSSK
jgi:hypothetical protein